MKYNKPEVKALGSAIKAVQGVPKDDLPIFDGTFVKTTNAYEADE